MKIREAIASLVSGKDLTEEQTREVFDQMMSGNAEQAQIASFLTALRIKGETVSEITGAAKVMREKALKIDPGREGVYDTCGTGGTGKDVFNVSTVSVFVLAACGIRVAKHGNRAASSQCGSADVLERLGVKIETAPEVAQKCLDELGVAFLFAPVYHVAMKYAAPVRKQIGIRTVFNILGPLCNPAGADSQVLGVFRGDLALPMAKVLGNLGVKKALVVHGADGLDEASLTTTTAVTELKEGAVKEYEISPEDFGFSRTGLEELKGGSVDENANIARAILKGDEGPKTDMVLLNCAIALLLAGKADEPRDAVSLAKRSISSKEAYGKLEELVKLTNG